MKKVLIIGANGQIGRIVIDRLLKEQDDTELTLYLRNSSRLSSLAGDRVKIIEGDSNDLEALKAAMSGQDIVYVAFVDHDEENTTTKNVIEAMKDQNVRRIISSNELGIYDEVEGEFGRWNKEAIASGLPTAIRSDELLEKSGLDYTSLRLPWLNDRDEVKYIITHKNEVYNGVSGSRQSMADVVVRIVQDPEFAKNDSIGIADAETQGEDRPVY
ncbi:NAD(P)H-binding protein [Alkalibacterium olivapovliticus]|uniref:Putative NADH-flavin reductase n=1 Tax=Alkalibacterium olivapovliticus TaxID=99907 RepID=A0A2T0VWZ4_9LACT|nr:NAD(P)H-binding protein [Alkalibacterium olivapovliticus]PRY76518.1 putative NADH-flavin reductase [Alkalibacterium olivapovliticus]